MPIPRTRILPACRPRSPASNGNSTEAIDALQTAVMLKPEDVSLRKTLASTYEEQDNWKDALDERMSILKFFPEPPEQELLALAATAIRARQLAVAETACQTVLETAARKRAGQCDLWRTAACPGGRRKSTAAPDPRHDPFTGPAGTLAGHQPHLPRPGQ